MTAPVRPRPATERDLLFMTTPALWPAWPLLPVVRRHPDGRLDCGLMYDCRGAARLAGLSATVFLGNLFQLPKTLDEFLKLPREIYDTPEEVAAAGWRVDRARSRLSKESSGTSERPSTQRTRGVA
jgi:hypothetical protein